MCLYVCKCIQRVYTKLQMYIKRIRIYIRKSTKCVYLLGGWRIYIKRSQGGRGKGTLAVYKPIGTENVAGNASFGILQI